MGVEIERKFLPKSDAWRTQVAQSVVIRQGYLSDTPERTVRVRVKGEQGFLTVKGRNTGAVRAEFDYPIPAIDAHAMLDALCLRPLVEKTRHIVQYGDLVWEIDEFAGDNAGLVVAEVELASAGQVIALPDWIGTEVTDDARYYNSSLVRAPYRLWCNH